MEAIKYSDRLMRFMAGIAKSAVLSEVVRDDDPMGMASPRYLLDIDGKRGVVEFNEGSVSVLRGDGSWTLFGLPKKTKGRAQARRIYDEIVYADRRAAERVAAIEAQQARAIAEKAHREEMLASARSLQATFDGLMADRSLPNNCGVRFYVPGSSGGSYVPSYAPWRASVMTSLEVTPENAARLLDLLVEHGFIRPMRRPAKEPEAAGVPESVKP